MNRNTLSVIIALSLMLLTSLACGLVSQLAPEAAPATEEPANADAEDAEISPAEEAVVETSQDDADAVSDALVPPPPSDGGPCANTFYPMIPGYQWIYEVTSEGETSQISLTVTEVNGNEATLNALYLESGVTTEAIVECQDGAILNFPVILLGFIFGDVNGEMVVEYVDGVFAPNYETMTRENWDHTWTGEYVASGVIDAEIDGDLITGRLEESPLDMEWNTLGAGEAIFDSITVRAGEFPRAIKLERETKFDFTAEMEEEGQTVSLSAVLTLHNNLWFELNMGQLKQEIERASIKVYGVSFPIEMTGIVELVEFRTEE
ncbi:MAG: hypothetical protein ISS57_01310 [Anaerolineales bacterium]|nr:hypothetical protein [Anaerolineales bacterium]